MSARRILLAEDEPDHASLIRRAINTVDESLITDVVHDGVEAIEYLFASGNHAQRDPQFPPDLILLDLKMPRMGGLEVLQVLRRSRGREIPRFPPVVVLTSSRAENDVADAYDLGAHSYVQKPMGFRDLVETVRKIIDYWIGVNESPPSHPHEAHSAVLRWRFKTQDEPHPK